MKQLQANFIISAEKLSQCPETILPEFPLLGRSNVGKSSFINALANNKKIAKTSNTPGKTRLINFFNFADKFMVADLPGYGREVNTDKKYMDLYLQTLKDVDIILLIIQANDKAIVDDIDMVECLYTWSKEGLI